ncbi:MAG TPA: aconitate hydratase AcnA [Candidatus Dormibacteraeota bacterium]|nr:aconitate hydratase AcnA [Candidatus Dormibacteraeota bacterium]
MVQTTSQDPLGVRAELGRGGPHYFSLPRLRELGLADPDRLPSTVKVWLEMLLREAGSHHARVEDALFLANWQGQVAEADRERELPYFPSRVLLQDFTGVPAVVDLASMRSAVARAGGDPARIDPLVGADLVIDHSVQVDAYGSEAAYGTNLEREYQRNYERYSLLRWAQQAFRGFRVVPPGMGICHQVNLEYLGRVVQLREQDGHPLALPDTLVGTDSHTTMINALGILGWGVGGIEAEAAMLGQPLLLTPPQVVGVRFTGRLQPGVTATDLVLRVTQWLRGRGVVGKFVEFCGAGLDGLSLADRATISNMAPEYGATASLFPVDQTVLDYLATTGRPRELIDLVDRYTKEQGLFRTTDSPIPTFSELLELDLDTIEPSVAGPRRPQDRVPLAEIGESFTSNFPPSQLAASAPERPRLEDGSVVIAAITSCTNTSNPSVMVAAGLLAKRAVARGIRPPDFVKTSMAPGSRVVTDYLRQSALLPALEEIGFDVVGYGCTTCIGNSGPLPDQVAREVEEQNLTVAAVLSGNRNFEGRIHPQVRAAYLASPPMVVAFALAGTVRRDLTKEPLGIDSAGQPVYLSELWPSAAEVDEVIASAVKPEFFTREYQRIFGGDEHWAEMDSPTGPSYQWDQASTYIREMPLFLGMSPRPKPVPDVVAARALALLGDSVTTDHISPAGAIAPTSPAGEYLQSLDVGPREFNSYGSRRGNHEVMIRGTFGNSRLRNRLAEGREGWYTTHQPDGEPSTIYDASVKYRDEGVPLIVIGGKEYGSGSSRDWAAKGTALLGVRVVLAESFERIHRSNLVGMGVLPIQFQSGETAETLGLDGTESYSLEALDEALKPRAQLQLAVTDRLGRTRQVSVVARVDSQNEVEQLRHGGVLQMVLRQILGE